ncbi:MAG TPA: electron transfer flavoprotein subunit alpha/FixB family protein [Spirochaetota bacterium]|nr:electron transfer flavoprotein subunit alpha/FixB family protein [Spirochaetota bacterium]HPJ36372.1 electron transfer flavoprotein subunit alpha/FixB family protein [Spirochaetota bacterium]
MMNLKEYKAVAVIDSIEDRVMPQSLELLPFSMEAGNYDYSEILLILFGRDIKEEGSALSEKYGIDTAVIESEQFFYPNPDLMMKALREVISQCRPEILCFTNTIRNNSVASGISILSGATCITAVESIIPDDGAPSFHRSIYNGKLVERIKTDHQFRVFTVMPGAFQADAIQQGLNGSLTIIKFDADDVKYRPSTVSRDTEIGSKLEDADVVISAGRGIGKPENLELVRSVARIFGNSAIGASRPVCDNKWLPYRHQVGVTGKTVSPKLYMALGISGSQQHITGMKNSQCIVSVNRDPHAAIFSVSDYSIVEDIMEFLPVFLKKYHERSSGEN